RHTRSKRDWSSDVCSSDLEELLEECADGPRRLDLRRLQTSEPDVAVDAAEQGRESGCTVLEDFEGCGALDGDREHRHGDEVLREIGRASCRGGVGLTDEGG